ncbi:hypothetical protein GGR57DRAFT_470599 [Xylariaceae sp. FL1272]|nr:hypothetical protein GGR57DRAFT_470599 [Xylariaceae sp. FL1272]
MNVSTPDTPSTAAATPGSSARQSHDSPGNTHDPHHHQNASLGPPAATATHITGPITLDPFAPVSDQLNPRSCVTCRRRKVRCDKHMPCSNCRKAQIQCVFPAPGRAPRRPRPKDPNAPAKHTSEREMELLKRLRKLEGIVEDLSGQIEVDAYKHASESPEADATSPDVPHDSDRRRPTATSSDTYLPLGHPLPRRSNTANSTASNPSRGPVAEVNKGFGKLVLGEQGKTRYVSNKFLSKITDEIDALRSETQRLNDDSSDTSDDEDPDVPEAPPHNPCMDQNVDHHGFIFGYSSSDVDLRKLHPLPSQLLFYWQIYQENINPIIRILHVPTMTKVIRDLRSNMSSINPGLEALMFSIYYAAITSMEPEDVLTNFGTEKSQLIARYRFGTEQALAKANCLNTSDMVVVQAFMLFLVLVRRYDDSRFAWTLTGLLIRIAQSLGLQRDGTHFAGLTPFDIEMRRRLWWAICVLDLRSAEDQGSELIVVERTYDTQFPLNVNDEDLSPDMTELPRERSGPTDMSFCLIRYELCALSRKFHSQANPLAACAIDHNRSVEENEETINDMYRHIEQKYLKPSPDKDKDLLGWVSATITRLIVSKMSLVVYQPLAQTASTELTSDIRDRLFMSTINVIEYSRVLSTEPKITHWRWLFQTYTQWHAVAYLLLEICRRPWSASVERGWSTMDAIFHSYQPIEFSKPAIWGPLRKLMLHANRHRQKELTRLRADSQAAQKLDADEQSRIPPATFQHLASSVRGTLARDRWYSLVGLPPPQKPLHDPVFTPKMKAKDQPRSQEPEPLAHHASQDIDVLLGQPHFNPLDIYSIAYPGNPSTMHEYAGMVGANSNGTMSGDFKMELPNVPVEHFNSRGSTAFAPEGQSNVATVLGPVGENLTPGLSDDNPPPWLWNNQPVPNYSLFPGAALEDDQDVNMDVDEVVNWQNWMDPGVSMGRVGFTGGI